MNVKCQAWISRPLKNTVNKLTLTWCWGKSKEFNGKV